jgi:hypothetical protein
MVVYQPQISLGENLGLLDQQRDVIIVIWALMYSAYLRLESWHLPCVYISAAVQPALHEFLQEVATEGGVGQAAGAQQSFGNRPWLAVRSRRTPELRPWGQ